MECATAVAVPETTTTTATLTDMERARNEPQDGCAVVVRIPALWKVVLVVVVVAVLAIAIVLVWNLFSRVRALERYNECAVAITAATAATTTTTTKAVKTTADASNADAVVATYKLATTAVPTERRSRARADQTPSSTSDFPRGRARDAFWVADVHEDAPDRYIPSGTYVVTQPGCDRRRADDNNADRRHCGSARRPSYRESTCRDSFVRIVDDCGVWREHNEREQPARYVRARTEAPVQLPSRRDRVQQPVRMVRLEDRPATADVPVRRVREPGLVVRVVENAPTR